MNGWDVKNKINAQLADAGVYAVIVSNFVKVVLGRGLPTDQRQLLAAIGWLNVDQFIVRFGPDSDDPNVEPDVRIYDVADFEQVLADLAAAAKAGVPA